MALIMWFSIAAPACPLGPRRNALHIRVRTRRKESPRESYFAFGAEPALLAGAGGGGLAAAPGGESRLVSQRAVIKLSTPLR